MQIQVIGSSSKGNCYVLKTATGSLLLECGVSIQEIKKALDFDLSDIKGCLISHEHKDHCKCVDELMKLGIDMYMSHGTAEALYLDHHRLNTVTPSLHYIVEDFYIQPLEMQHDAVEPLGFLIVYKPTGEQLLFATDTYYIKYKFKDLNYIMVECNYDPEILDANLAAGLIHPTMRDRLLSSHFSLTNVLDFIKANDMSTVKKIILMHLSDANSDAAKMRSAVVDQSQRPVYVAEPGMLIDLVKCPF